MTVASNVGTMTKEERASCSLGTNVSRLNGSVDLDRNDNLLCILFMHIMNGNGNVLDSSCDMVGFDDINGRLAVFKDWSWFIRNFIAKVVVDRTKNLCNLGGYVERSDFGVSRVC